MEHSHFVQIIFIIKFCAKHNTRHLFLTAIVKDIVITTTRIFFWYLLDWYNHSRKSKATEMQLSSSIHFRLLAQLSLNCVSMSVSFLLTLAAFKRDPPRPSRNETLLLTQLRKAEPFDDIRSRKSYDEKY